MWHAEDLHKCFTLEKNALHLKNALHFKKYTTVPKMRYTRKTAALEKFLSHDEKCGTLGKMWHILKKAPPLEKCGTLAKGHHT